MGAAEAIRVDIGTTLPIVPKKMHDEVRQSVAHISEREHGNSEVFSVYLNEGMRLGLLKSVARAGEFAQEVISSGASG